MNIAIIDDNREDCSKIAHFTRNYINRNMIDLSVHIFSYQKERDFLDKFERHYFDLVFIDYYLEQYTGLELAKLIRKEDETVILLFITCSRDYAVESYKVKASGYLVKPLVYDEFAEIMSLLDAEKLRKNQCMEIINNYETERIKIKEIVSCEADGHYVRLLMWNGQVKKYRSSFMDFIEKLKPFTEFLYCYRGCMVNMQYIKDVNDQAFVMSNGSYVPFRKKQKAKILKYYYDYLFQCNRDMR